MKTLVVVGHPNLARSVVNKTWTDAIRAIQNENLRVHALDEVVRADGSFDIVAEQRLLQEYDRIILQFPFYWYMVPGIMKEWMDTVWAEGWCYGEGGVHLEGKLIEAAVSCGAPEFCFDATKPGNISIETYMSFIVGSAAFVRARAGRIFAFYGAESDDVSTRLVENTRAYIDFVTKE